MNTDEIFFCIIRVRLFSSTAGVCF